MIRNFSALCKYNLNLVSSLSLFRDSLDQFSIEAAACPCCHSKGSMKRHATYNRNMISLEGGSVICHSLEVLRVQCSSCGHTHAVLPDVLIPYGSYSLFFILAVLKEYFLCSQTVQSLCLRYEISVSTLYAFRDLFLCHKKLWLGILADSQSSALEFLNEHFEQSPFSALTSGFFLTFAFSFFQGGTVSSVPAPP